MKKFCYTLCFTAVLAAFGILVHQRYHHHNTTTMPQSAQTIIPVAPQLVQQTASPAEDKLEHIQSVITLLSDEIPVEDIPVDINGDGKEDKIIAAKKLSDQFIYLFLFLQDNTTQTFTRAAEIKTEATHAKTFSMYTTQVSEYDSPIIVYSGMNADTMQVFGIYALEIDMKRTIITHSLVNIQAEGHIILKTQSDNSLTTYTISAYYSDSDAPNTLNQIEKDYTWNEKKYHFEQTKEVKIPGKKIESRFLQKFQTGTVQSFQAFLEGLWYQPSAKKDQNRRIFFNFPENEIIFAGNNIQEIFTVDSMTPRRFGIYFSTKNASISSIHRRIVIELRSIDEVYIQVIDDIARLKIGVASNWDGVYRKINNAVRTMQTPQMVEHTKKRLTAQGKTWENPEGYTLHFSDYSYQLQQDTEKHSGQYTIFPIKEHMVLQLKDTENKEHFFTITFDDNSTQLTLMEVSVTATGITLRGTPPLQFK